MSTPWRVVIADDHAFYRKGLVRMLRDSGVEVVADLPNGEAAIPVVAKLRPDAVLMDLNMPGLSGAEATRSLVEQCPGIPVLMLSVSTEEADVAEAIVAGASGYVLKESPVEEVVVAIREAVAGGTVLSERLAMVLLPRLKARADVRYSAFSAGRSAPVRS
jgi:two-component system, NarL family, nitrate/nitrite response regulator NarL